MELLESVYSARLDGEGHTMQVRLTSAGANVSMVLKARREVERYIIAYSYTV